MVDVVLMPPFDRELGGGDDRLELEAASLFALVAELDRRSPGFAQAAGLRATLAVDGMVTGDWSQSLSGASEVIVMPRIAGG
ncbi:MAG TPA: hypothetical protein VJM34_11395 [Novosphingobium sp.]|nr:hypothetical protein [Novosphingobium sp.]